MFDGKGMTLKKPGCARVEMRWNQIHDRIRNLVRKDSYLSVEEAEKRRARHSSEEELFDEVPNLSEETQEPRTDKCRRSCGFSDTGGSGTRSTDGRRI